MGNTDRRGRPRKRAAPVPRRPTSARAAPTFDAVVEAAARVLGEHGFAGMTTNRIADLAGVSIGSLYQYFPNKEAIVFALIDRYLPKIAAIARAAFDEGTSIQDVARRLMLGMISVPPLDRAVFARLWELRTAADAHDRVDAHLAELVRHGAATLRRLELATDDADALAFVAVHSADGLINALARSRDVDIPRVSRLYLDLVTSYLARR